MRQPDFSIVRRAASHITAMSAGFVLLTSCVPDSVRDAKQADVWYCFAMDRTGKKWAYRAENIEDASGAAIKACRAESVEPRSCQAPEAANCSNTGAGFRTE